MEEKNKDELYNEEEYRKALEVVNGSKKSSKKSKKKETEVSVEDDTEDIAVAEGGNEEDQSQDGSEAAEDTVDGETEVTEEGEDAEDDASDDQEDTDEDDTEESKPAVKSEKKKFDPVIPICLVLAVLVVIGAVCYFTLPGRYKKNLGVTIEELRLRYQQTTEYTTYMSDFGFMIPEVAYSQGGQSNVDRFEANINNSAVPYLTSIMGSTRSVDGKIVNLRVLASYSDSEDYFNFLMIYYASYLHVFYPDLDEGTIRNMVMTSLSNVGRNAETDFIVNGDYGYRTIYENRDLGTYVVFEIENAGNLLQAEIAQQQ